MHRRKFLAATVAAIGTGGSSGCASSGQSQAGTPTQTTTARPATDAADGGTPVPLPESCAPPPDIQGLPERPAELSEDGVAEYVSDFERVYAVAANPEYGSIERLDLTDVRAVGDRYRVQLAVEAIPKTATAGPDGGTPTGMPPDALAHKALYRVAADRMVRELRGYAGGARLSSECWSFSSSET